MTPILATIFSSVNVIIGFFLVPLVYHPPAVVNAFDLCNITDSINRYKYSTQNVTDCCVNSAFNSLDMVATTVPADSVPPPTFCVRKCCPVGFETTKGWCVRSTNQSEFTVSIYQEQNEFLGHVAVSSSNQTMIGTINYCDFFALQPSESTSPYNDFWLQPDGRLMTSFYGTLDLHQYCLDHMKGQQELFAFICLPKDIYEKENIVLQNVHSIGMIISMPFLLLTIFIYALLPDRNLHMKALICYMISLFFGYLLLVVIHYHTKFDKIYCTTIGHLCLFFFMVSFLWMNVICIDIWLAFSGLQRISGYKTNDQKRFTTYCIYTWGVAVLHSLLVFLMDTYTSPFSWMHPGVGKSRCFLENGFAELLYLLGPMTVIITVNIILFATTALRIRKIKQDTSILKRDENGRHCYENHRQKFNLYLKLLFAMGINWSMEIVSWLIDWSIGHVPPYIWYLTDFCNATYGVFIFFIFVCKGNVWRLLKKRYYTFIGKFHQAHILAQAHHMTSFSATHNSSLQETRSHSDPA